jgi:hypothetical protein
MMVVGGRSPTSPHKTRRRPKMVSEGRRKILLAVVPQQHRDLVDRVMCVEQELPGILQKSVLLVLPDRIPNKWRNAVLSL